MSLIYDRAADIVRTVFDKRLSAPPVLDPSGHFPGSADFERHWRAIRDEALEVAASLGAVPRFHEIMPEQAEISANDGRDWRMFIMKGYGAEWPRNLERCPRLAALVRAHPEVLSASFSFLAPGKHIPAHRGPFRGVLRYFLVLSMPLDETGEPAAVLRVDGAEHRLHDGESLLWDDTYEHEVWNRSDRVRVVLLLDVWRPGMPPDLALLSHLVVGLVRVGTRLRGFG